MKEEDNKDLPSNFVLITTLKKQNEILKRQLQLQERISNNILYFFWVSIITLIIFPLFILLPYFLSTF